MTDVRNSSKGLKYLLNGDPDSTMDTNGNMLVQSLVLNQKERYNLGRSYLMDLREINKVNLKNQQGSQETSEVSENPQNKLIEYKIKNKTVKKGRILQWTKLKKSKPRFVI